MNEVQLDALAKQRGFPDYQTMLAFERNRQQARSSGTHENVLSASPQDAEGVKMLYPPYLLQWVADKMKAATAR